MNEKKTEDLIFERIRKLFSLAEKSFEKNPGRSHRYAELIRRLSMRHNVRLPGEIRRRVCRKCNKFLVPGKNCRVRANNRQRAVIVTCLECGNIVRYPYRREKSNTNKKKKTNIK